jgi:thymidylate synthase
MKAYLDIVGKILSQGVCKKNRTGIDALTIAGAMFEHDMALGFPLLTTKKSRSGWFHRNWSSLSGALPTRNG